MYAIILNFDGPDQLMLIDDFPSFNADVFEQNGWGYYGPFMLDGTSSLLSYEDERW